MPGSRSGSRLVRRLAALRNRYDARSGEEKLALLDALAGVSLRAPDLEQLHGALGFIRAFPDSREHWRRALALLESFESRVERLGRRQRALLDDTGIAGTCLRYQYSFVVALWLSCRHPGRLGIDWDAIEDPARLDEAVAALLETAEVDLFESGTVSTREWLALAKAFGWNGHEVRRSRELASVLEAAFEEKGPSLVVLPIDARENNLLMERLGRIECPI